MSIEALIGKIPIEHAFSLTVAFPLRVTHVMSCNESMREQIKCTTIISLTYKHKQHTTITRHIFTNNYQFMSTPAEVLAMADAKTAALS